MVAIHVTSSENVEATLNAWIKAGILAFSMPSYLSLSASNFVYTMPETGIVPPCYGVFHIPVITRNEWQGQKTGTEHANRATALMDINVYVSRVTSTGAKNTNWTAQLRRMTAMVEQLKAAQSSASIIIKDYSVPAAPANTGYIVHLADLENIPVSPDINPSIERRRLQLRYWWIARTSV